MENIKLLYIDLFCGAGGPVLLDGPLRRGAPRGICGINKVMTMNEIWKPVVGFEDFYEVSNLGNVRRKKSKRLRAISHTSLYSHILLSANGKHTTLRVHRIVAEAFLPRIDGKPHINHKNGNKNDNRVENLEWVSQAENNLHAYRTLHRKPTLLGHVPHNKKLFANELEDIDKLLNSGLTAEKIALSYNIHPSTIRKRIKRYRNGK